MTSDVQKKIDRYTPSAIEAKWRERWASSGLHNTPDDSDKPNFYFLTMFPYPSGEIHVGHWYAFAPPDAAARFMRMWRATASGGANAYQWPTWMSPEG